MFNTHIPQSESVVIDLLVTDVQLLTHDCIHGVINPFYHSRHDSRPRHYEYDREI